MSQPPAGKRKFDLAGYRHQLLTPLNHIIGHAELLLDELPEAGYSSLYQDLKRIRETARGLVRRIHTGLVPNPGKSWAKVLADLRYEMIAPLHTILQGVGAITSEYRNDLNVADVLQIGRAAAELLSFAQGHQIPGAEHTIPTPASRQPAVPRSGRILIVDDNQNSRQLLRRQLERQGYQVTAAESGAEALAVLVQSEQDLVLLDVLMPKLDGFQVLERIKADPALADIPVIVLSALNEIPGVVRSIEIGAEDYLFKPFDTVLLSARICSALEKKRLRDLEHQQIVGERQKATEAEEANRQLQLSEQRLHLALRADHAFIWDWDLADRVTQWSPAGAPGQSHSSLDAMLALVHPDDRVRIRRKLLASIASKTNFQEECRVVQPDGGLRWFAIMAVLESDASGQPVRMTGVARDISEQRQAESALRKSNQDFQRFAMAASHDLREPLRAVESDLEALLSHDHGLSSASRDQIASAIARLGHMSKLMRDLLDYSEVSLKRDQRRPTSAEAVLAMVLNDLKIMIEESGAEITHDPLPAVLGDFMMLHRLFQNLISNSMKYRSAEKPRIHISAERQDGYWKFAVRDNGVGIAARHHETIFGVFHRLHSGDVPGSGLGLAICRRILERLNGKIWVESEAGKGSTFFFTLPAS